MFNVDYHTLKGGSKMEKREGKWDKQINIQLKSTLNLCMPQRRQRACSRERWLQDYNGLNVTEMDSQAGRNKPYLGALSY